MSCVRKAVIPAAGFGTRLYPATKSVDKEMFPIVDRDGLAKPLIHLIVQEALDSGIERVCLIVRRDRASVFEEYFKGDLSSDLHDKLMARDWAREQTIKVKELGERIDFVFQDKQEGFGHAVCCAQQWVGNEPFLLMLGDHTYVSETKETCCRQVLNVFEQSGFSTVGADRTPGRRVHLYGTLKADPVSGSTGEYHLREYVEKPSAEFAKSNLRVQGLGENDFLCLFGIYVLKSRVFDHMQELLTEESEKTSGEVQFTDALDRLRQEEGEHRAFEVKGSRFDVGVPDEYLATLQAYGNMLKL